MLAVPLAHAAAATDPPQTASSPEVVSTTFQLVDRSRSTAASPGQPVQDHRALPTLVHFPLQRTHALPLIVVAHGRNGSPRQLDALLDAWASAGYVVASPRLPRVALDRHGRPSSADAERFAGDLGFVITKLEELSASSTANPVRGLVDPGHVGVAGISLGGQAVYALISHTCCRDPRVSAAVLLSAVRRPLPNGAYEPQSATVLLVHGRADVGYHHSASTYPQLAAPKWFVTLREGTHGPPFEDEDDPHDALVQEVTTAFWDLSLAGDQAGAHRIEHAVATSHGDATLERRLR